MPHCIIEYSKALEQEVEAESLVSAAQAGIVDSGLFESADIKIRALAYETQWIGCARGRFVHVTTRIFSGRSNDTKRRLSGLIQARLERLVPPPLSLTVEICDIHRESYAKKVLEPSRTPATAAPESPLQLPLIAPTTQEHPYVGLLKNYLDALGRGDYATIKGLFAPSATVRSPFLGEMAAGPFFDRLAEVTTGSVVIPLDILIGTAGRHHAAAYFQHNCRGLDGTLVTLRVIDLFTFEPDGERIVHLDIIHDTHPERIAAGNRYGP